MRRVRWLIGGYLVVAAMTRLAEAAGLHRCGCAPGCWCRRPVLSAFRWVFPYGHRGVDGEEKRSLAADA